MPARKLSTKDLDLFRATLVRARAELTGDVRYLEEEALGRDGSLQSGESREDAGTESYFQEFNLELLQRDESTLREIEAALERVDAGTYGRCEGCEEWILKERLKAVPHARNCIDCQRRAERSGYS